MPLDAFTWPLYVHQYQYVGRYIRIDEVKRPGSSTGQNAKMLQKHFLELSGTMGKQGDPLAACPMTSLQLAHMSPAGAVVILIFRKRIAQG